MRLEFRRTSRTVNCSELLLFLSLQLEEVKLLLFHDGQPLSLHLGVKCLSALFCFSAR
jgi:hypothetical protein